MEEEELGRHAVGVGGSTEKHVMKAEEKKQKKSKPRSENDSILV